MSEEFTDKTPRRCSRGIAAARRRGLYFENGRPTLLVGTMGVAVVMACLTRSDPRAAAAVAGVEAEERVVMRPARKERKRRKQCDEPPSLHLPGKQNHLDARP